MGYKLHLSCSANTGYRIEFEHPIDPSALTVTLTEVSFYDEADSDDHILEVDKAELNFEVIGEGPKGIVVAFSGWVVVEMSAETLAGLEQADFSMDYLLEFEVDGQALESDVDYAFVSNQNVGVRVE